MIPFSSSTCLSSQQWPQGCPHICTGWVRATPSHPGGLSLQAGPERGISSLSSPREASLWLPPPQLPVDFLGTGMKICIQLFYLSASLLFMKTTTVSKLHQGHGPSCLLDLHLQNHAQCLGWKRNSEVSADRLLCIKQQSQDRHRPFWTYLIKCRGRALN